MVFDRLLGRGRHHSAALELDTVYELLANERRRWLIDHLASADEPLSKGDLAELLAFVEADGVDHPQDVSSRARKAAFVSLHQTHLGELEAAGVIEWTRQDLVSPTPLCEQVAAINREVRGMCGGEAHGE